MRYALYYAPEPGSELEGLAEIWLGRDAATAREGPQLQVQGLAPQEFFRITASPRRYGFHGTLKAPFRLAAGHSEGDLIAAMEAFAARRKAFAVPHMKADLLGGFVAIVPAQPCAALDSLAADVVEFFEPLRARLTADEIARRNPDSLSPQERANLERWGYPYVFEQFRFHLTLSERLDPETGARVRDFAGRHFAPALAVPLSVGGVTLFVEPERGEPFTIRRRVPFAAANARKTA